MLHSLALKLTQQQRLLWLFASNGHYIHFFFKCFNVNFNSCHLLSFQLWLHGVVWLSALTRRGVSHPSLAVLCYYRYGTIFFFLQLQHSSALFLEQQATQSLTWWMYFIFLLSSAAFTRNCIVTNNGEVSGPFVTSQRTQSRKRCFQAQCEQWRNQQINKGERWNISGKVSFTQKGENVVHPSGSEPQEKLHRFTAVLAWINTRYPN